MKSQEELEKKFQESMELEGSAWDWLDNNPEKWEHDENGHIVFLEENIPQVVIDYAKKENWWIDEMDRVYAKANKLGYSDK